MSKFFLTYGSLCYIYSLLVSNVCSITLVSGCHEIYYKVGVDIVSFGSGSKSTEPNHELSFLVMELNDFCSFFFFKYRTKPNHSVLV